MAEAGACVESHTEEWDGWYLAGQNIPNEKSRASAALIGSSQCADTVVSHGTLAYPGVRVREQRGAYVTQLLALRYDPINAHVFEVPSDFTKVDSIDGQPNFSWSGQMAFGWRMLMASLQSWF